jgi:hypothetical protein
MPCDSSLPPQVGLKSSVHDQRSICVSLLLTMSIYAHASLKRTALDRLGARLA